MHKYRLISKKGEGTFSEVLKAQSIKSGKHVAIKCMKTHFDSIDQVNNLREIQALRRLVGHPNIIKLHEVLYDEPTGRLALVFELMDMDLYAAIKGRRHYLPEQKVKHYMYETCKAIDHMHRNGIFHRDVKPENLLLEDDVIKLADLGSCRGIYSRQPFTEYISTRWYRAPECLLTDGYYNFKMDLFAVGAVCFEIVALFPLFPGQNEMDQIQKIHNVLGTPSPELLTRKFKRNASHMDFNFPEKKGTGLERLIPHADAELVELMRKLIRYDPDDRILARQALKDPYFRDLRDAEKDAAANSQPPLQPPNVGSRPREHVPMMKAGMSSSSSIASTDHENPETTHEPVGGASQAASSGQTAADEERTGALPTIRQENRKERVAREAAANKAAAQSGGPESGEEAVVDEGTVLPPIGGLKGKRGSKAQTLKQAGNSALQKPSMPSSTTHGVAAVHGGGAGQNRALGVLGTSKGFAGTSSGSGVQGASVSSTDAMSSTNPHSWATKDSEHRRTSSPSSAPMNSTWAPNHNNQPRRMAPGGKNKR
jgi:renal tumor antigen